MTASPIGDRAATGSEDGSAASPAMGGGREVEAAFDPLPAHVAIIMDGNRRWARERGLPEAEGHAAGVDAVRRTVSHALRRGISVLSLYAFSRENWGRSDAEVSWLLGLLESAIRTETPDLVEQGVEVRLLGRLDELPEGTRRSIESALERTRSGPRLRLNIAFNYAGRTEIVDAVRSLVRSGLPADAIDEEAVAGALYTAGLPDPDLVVRTGGEQRLSNFLIWQSAYAEFVSTPVQWPSFGAEALDDALSDYARRSRRFGR